ILKCMNAEGSSRLYRRLSSLRSFEFASFGKTADWKVYGTQRTGLLSHVDAGVASMSERSDAIAPRGLCQVHCAIRHLDQLLFVLGASRITRHSNARGHLTNFLHRCRSYRFPDPVGHHDGAFALTLWKNHDKFLASVTGANIYVSNAGLYDFGYVT